MTADLTIAGQYHVPEIDTTMEYARTIGPLALNHMAIIRADRQTSGRGQRSNTFFSSINGGLWATILIHIPDLTSHFRYNRAISMAIFDGCAEMLAVNNIQNHSLAIKWPNDLYWANKKICGILLESGMYLNHIAIGFGINLTIDHLSFPKELVPIATSILIETGVSIGPEVLLAKIIDYFQEHISKDETALHEWYSRRLYRLGNQVSIQGSTGTFKGVCIDGRLMLEKDHETVYFSSGTPIFKETT